MFAQKAAFGMKRKHMKIVFLLFSFGIMWSNQGCDVFSSEDCMNLNSFFFFGFLLLDHITKFCWFLHEFWYEKHNIYTENDAYSLCETAWFAFTQSHVFIMQSMLRNALLAATFLKPTYQSPQSCSGRRQWQTAVQWKSNHSASGKMI